MFGHGSALPKISTTIKFSNLKLLYRIKNSASWSCTIGQIILLWLINFTYGKYAHSELRYAQLLQATALIAVFAWGKRDSPRTITRVSLAAYGCIKGKAEGSIAFCIVGCESIRRSWFCGLGGLLLLGTSNDVRVCDLAKLTCFVFGTCVVGGGGAGGNTGRGPSNFVDSSSSGSHVYL